MIYEYEYVGTSGRGRILFDPEKIEARIRSSLRIYVKPTTQQKRAELLDFLDSQGFKPDENWRKSRDEVLEAPYPVCVMLDKKTYSSMGNTTCAAAAASSKIIAPEELFYRLFRSETRTTRPVE